MSDVELVVVWNGATVRRDALEAQRPARPYDFQKSRLLAWLHGPHGPRFSFTSAYLAGELGISRDQAASYCSRLHRWGLVTREDRPGRGRHRRGRRWYRPVPRAVAS